MKKSITFNQLKRLVNEGKFSDRMHSLDNPEYGDQEEYKHGKWRETIRAQVTKLRKNEDCREAVQLIEKLTDIAHDRLYDTDGVQTENDFMYTLQSTIRISLGFWFNTGLVTDYDGFSTDASILGDEEAKYGVWSMLVLWLEKPGNEDNPILTWAVKRNIIRFQNSSDEDATGKQVWDLSNEKDVDELIANGRIKDAYKLLVKLNADTSRVIQEAEDYWTAVTAFPWFKNKEFDPEVDEGRFVKRLAALGEGRFAKRLAELDAMTECGDESVKLNENTKITLTVKQLRRLVKEAAGTGQDPEAAVAHALDMYRACKVEPKVCNAIKADGETTSIFLDKGNSIGGIVKALRDGRLLKVVDFN